MAEDDVERQWRVYESRASMAGEGEPAPGLEPELAGATVIVNNGGEDE
jgi:hypothetical protein